MVKKRIGCARLVKWTVLTNGELIPFEGRNISLCLRTPRNEEVEVENWATDFATILYQFDAQIQEQHGTGVYSLTLYENKGEENQTAVDTCNFIRLVDCTCKADQEPDDMVTEEQELETATLEVLSRGSGGDIPPEIYQQLADLQVRVGQLEETPIPSKTSELENDSQFTTEEQLQDKQDIIEDLEQIREGAGKGGTAIQPDALNEYAKKEDVPTKVSELDNDSGYLTEHQSLEDYAKKEDIPSIPTHISTFINDAGYLTEHQDLSDYAKKEDLESKQDQITDLDIIRSGARAGTTAVQPKELTQYATKDDLSRKADINDIPDISNLATKDELDAKIGVIDTALQTILGDEE